MHSFTIYLSIPDLGAREKFKLQLKINRIKIWENVHFAYLKINLNFVKRNLSVENSKASK